MGDTVRTKRHGPARPPPHEVARENRSLAVVVGDAAAVERLPES